MEMIKSNPHGDMRCKYFKTTNIVIEMPKVAKFLEDWDHYLKLGYMENSAICGKVR